MIYTQDVPIQLRFDELLPEGCLRPGGLTLPPDYPGDKWGLLIETLQFLRRADNWWLGDALQANHINPDAQTYLNLWTQPLPSHCDEDDLAFALCAIRQKQAQGVTVIAMGNLVAQHLYRAGIEHEKIKHPAARGSIRKRERYQAHVGEILSGAMHHGA